MRILVGRTRLSIDPDAQAIFNAFTTPPTVLRRAQITAVINALKTAGVWQTLDVLHVYAAADAQAALINWKRPGTYNATLVNSPTFVADRYISGDGITSYIESNFNPSTAVGANYQRNSASFGLWKSDMGAPTSSIAGYASTANGTSIVAGSTGGYRINGALTSPVAALIAASGMLSVDRSGATATTAYMSGVSVATGIPGSAAIANATFQLGAWNGGFVTTRFAAEFIGSSFMPAQHAAVSASLATYMLAVGAA